MKEVQFDLEGIAGSFEISESFVKADPYGNGHINDTFCAECSGGRRYILQRVNGHVFEQPIKLMENIERVTRHVRGKLLEQGKDPDRHGLTLIPQKNGGLWHIDGAGDVWRMYIFIEDTVAYDIVESAEVAQEGGKAFGEFQRLLADLPGEPLYETIPEFHNMENRFEMFRAAVKADKLSRVAGSGDQISFVEQREEAMTVLQRLGREGVIEQRITHNDTKINNVLFDASSLQAASVIDLDTVMPGYVLFDFGDSIRTTTNTGAEDDPNLSNVSINMELFEAYTRGYLSQATSFLSKVETSLLADSARIMTFIIGLRFFTDYLDGDRYFRILKPDHNLVRANAQFKLVTSMEARSSEMNDTVSRIVEGGFR